MQRKLASIQVIHDVQPIQGADAIECVSVLGWKCVVKKGEFKRLDLCVYFEVDSFLPVRDVFEFLRSSSYKKTNLMGEGFRIKTCKLRGQLSQGLALPLSILTEDIRQQIEKQDCRGLDVSASLDVKKWETEVSGNQSWNKKGEFPYFVPKTDEQRIQSAPELIEELSGKPYFITTKMDGTSFTAFKNGEGFGVCTRNMEIHEDDSVFWLLAKKHDLENKIEGYAVQGEVCAPKIQKNHLKLREPELFVFSIYDLSKGQFLSFEDYKKKIADWCLFCCPIEEEGEEFSYSMDELIERAKGVYPSGNKKEGIVIRPQNELYSPTLSGRLSFKIINNEFLLKED